MPFAKPQLTWLQYILTVTAMLHQTIPSTHKVNIALGVQSSKSKPRFDRASAFIYLLYAYKSALASKFAGLAPPGQVTLVSRYAKLLSSGLLAL